MQPGSRPVALYPLFDSKQAHKYAKVQLCCHEPGQSEKLMPAPGAAYVCINCLLCYAASQKLLEAWPIYGRSALRK